MTTFLYLRLILYKIVSILFILFSSSYLSAQGVTKYGAKSNNSADFVDKNGRVGSDARLSATGGVVPLPSSGTLTYNGDTYHYITIGTQTWMVENLKTTSYNDGTSIGTNFSSTLGAYVQVTAAPASYGKLYNWYAVNTGLLAPIGWHVPSSTEWTVLTTYVSTHAGISSFTPKALAATTGWVTTMGFGDIGNNSSSNNSSGFTAYPSGRGTSASTGLAYDCDWWSATQSNSSTAVYIYFFNTYSTQVYQASLSKNDGCAVRCIRDSQ